MQEDQGTLIELRTDTSAESCIRIHTIAEPYCDTPITVANPKKPIKFAVGSPGFRSGLWRAWSTGRSDDVYIKAMSEEGFTKISLHESGDWRHQIVDERTDHPKVHWISQRLDHESRVLDSWQRPQPTDGWIRAFTLLVPSKDVVQVPNDSVKTSQAKTWITQSPPGESSEFTFYLVENHSPARYFSHSGTATGPISVVGAFQLPSNSVFFVTHNHTKLTATEDQLLRELRHNHTQNLPPDFSTSPDTGPRAVAWATYEDGYRVYFDLGNFDQPRQLI